MQFSKSSQYKNSSYKETLRFSRTVLVKKGIIQLNVFIEFYEMLIRSCTSGTRTVCLIA